MRWLFAIALACTTSMGCGQGTTGRACVIGSTPCPAGWQCASGSLSMQTRCMQECSLSETVCHDGSLCIPNAASHMGGVCYLGGSTPIGTTCADNVDCVRTGICLRSATGPQTACFVACNIDGSHACPNGAPCLPTTGMAGYCGN